MHAVGALREVNRVLEERGQRVRQRSHHQQGPRSPGMKWRVPTLTVELAGPMKELDAERVLSDESLFDCRDLKKSHWPRQGELWNHVQLKGGRHARTTPPNRGVVDATNAARANNLH
jgi:hypothetical protein